MTYSKMVFDYRSLEIKDLEQALKRELSVVMAGSEASAVFFLPNEIDVDHLSQLFRGSFNLAHVEHISGPQGAPYQIIRLERLVGL